MLPLSKRQVKQIERGLDAGHTILVFRHGHKVKVHFRQRHIYPSEQNTKTIRIYKEDYEKVRARAERDGTSASIALDKMLLEAFRLKVIRLLKNAILSKAS